ncbi:hypothetical protein DFJ74DRAFT_678018 [Hyaloraphidium curvatum]|nr:hypothetical protein DFJ74DRAFT_678018 [Hyaloraphidium curvatum]
MAAAAPHSAPPGPSSTAPALPVVDLSSPSPAALLHATHDVGFMYLSLPSASPSPRPLGPSHAQVARMFALAKEFFSLPAEEKEQYMLDGSYFLFKPDTKKTGYEPWDSIGVNRAGSFDVKATLNFPVFGMEQLDGWYANKQHLIPPVFREHWGEVAAFCDACHGLAMETLRALARGLLLEDEEYFVKRHRMDRPSGTYLRLLYYPAMDSSTEDMESSGRYRTPGHTDIGSLTFLFQDRVGGLQVRKGYATGPEGRWVDVPPRDGTAVVNIADMMQFVTGGYLKSTFHRVVAPAPDASRNPPRQSIAYFLHPNDDELLAPVPSPVLPAAGSGAGVTYKEGEAVTFVPTSKEWRAHRHAQTQFVDGAKDGMGGGGKEKL